MTEATMYDELVQATGINPFEEGDDKQLFVRDLLTGVNALEEEEWNALSPAAQKWFNDAANAMEADEKVELQLPDGMGEEAKPVVEEKPKRTRTAKPKAAAIKGEAKQKAPAQKSNGEDEAKPKRGRGRPAMSEEEKAAKAAERAANKPPRKPRTPTRIEGTGRMGRSMNEDDTKSKIRAIMCSDTSLSKEQVVEKLEAEGVTTTVNFAAAVYRNAARMIETILAVGEVRNGEGEVIIQAVEQGK